MLSVLPPHIAVKVKKDMEFKRINTSNKYRDDEASSPHDMILVEGKQRHSRLGELVWHQEARVHQICLLQLQKNLGSFLSSANLKARVSEDLTPSTLQAPNKRKAKY